MTSSLIEFFIISLLILLNGIFSMSELAVMSANRGRLAARASSGSKGAVAALYLIDHSSQFLATVQVGITLIGIFAGAYGGASFSNDLALVLVTSGMSSAVAQPLAFTLVVGVITYFSLVIGELVPKQIALSYPETVAVWVARPLLFFSVVGNPIVKTLESSSKLAIKFLPFSVGGRPEVSVDDIRHLISQGAEQGEIQAAEKDIAFRVFKLDDRPISAFMTPRHEVVWIDALKPFSKIWELALSVPHSFFPVAEGKIDRVLGVVSVKDLWLIKASEGKSTIYDIIRPALRVIDKCPALGVLEEFKRERRQVALVFDEHGGLDGIVTTHDLLEAIVGDLADYEGEGQSIVRRHDGTLLVDAAVDLHELIIFCKLSADNFDLSDEYHSIGGVIFAELKRAPSVGESIRWYNFIFEIVDMDGHRIDKVLISRIDEPEGAAEMVD